MTQKQGIPSRRRQAIRRAGRGSEQLRDGLASSHEQTEETEEAE